MSAIATYPSYKEAVRRIDCKIIKLAERLLTDGKVTATVRIERVRILRNVPIFQKSQYTRQLKTQMQTVMLLILRNTFYIRTIQDPLIAILVKQKANAILRS